MPEFGFDAGLHPAFDVRLPLADAELCSSTLPRNFTCDGFRTTHTTMLGGVGPLRAANLTESRLCAHD